MYANKHWTPKHLDDYITDYGGFIANRVLYCTFMAQYGASLLANVHTHIYILRMFKKREVLKMSCATHRGATFFMELNCLETMNEPNTIESIVYSPPPCYVLHFPFSFKRPHQTMMYY